eukprot:184324-Chlamydomonas_euryale.AAC.5
MVLSLDALAMVEPSAFVCTDAPQLDKSVLPAADDAIAVWRHNRRVDLASVPNKRVHRRIILLPAPQLDCLVPGRGNQLLVRAREPLNRRHMASVPVKCLNEVTGIHVPDFDELVSRSGGQVLAVVAYRNGIYGAAVSVAYVHYLLARHGVPPTHRLVMRHRHRTCTAGAQLHIPNNIAVTCKMYGAREGSLRYAAAEHAARCPALTVTNNGVSSSASLVWMLGWPYPDLPAGIFCLRPGWGRTEYQREAGPYSL